MIFSRGTQYQNLLACHLLYILVLNSPHKGRWIFDKRGSVSYEGIKFSSKVFYKNIGWWTNCIYYWSKRNSLFVALGWAIDPWHDNVLGSNSFLAVDVSHSIFYCMTFQTHKSWINTCNSPRNSLNKVFIQNLCTRKLMYRIASLGTTFILSNYFLGLWFFSS